MSLWYKTKSERLPVELEKGLDLLLCWFNQVGRPPEKFEYNKDKNENMIRPEEMTFPKIKAITLKLRVISLLSSIYSKASMSLCVCFAWLSSTILLPHSGLLLGPAMWSHRTQLQSHGQLALSATSTVRTGPIFSLIWPLALDRGWCYQTCPGQYQLCLHVSLYAHCLNSLLFRLSVTQQSSRGTSLDEDGSIES